MPSGSPTLETPFRLPLAALAGLFALAAFGGLLDYSIGPSDYMPIEEAYFALALLIAALLTWFDREGPWPARAKLFAAGFAVTWATVHLLSKHTRQESMHDLLPMILGSSGPWLWLLALWSATPVFIHRERYGGAVVWGTAIFLLYGLLCLASAADSTQASDSLGFQYFPYERGIVFALGIPWLRASSRQPALLRRTAGPVLAVMAGLTIVALIIVALDRFGGPAWRGRLEFWRFIFKEAHPGANMPARRLIFPMLHHNRAAYFGMVFTLGSLVAWMSLARDWARGEQARRGTLFVAMMVAGIAMALYSWTRGVLVLLLFALTLWCILGVRKSFWILAFASAVLLIVLPTHQRAFLLTVLDRKAYRPPPGQVTSMSARMLAWEFGLAQIAAHPLTGIGYGTRVVKERYAEFEKESADPRYVADRHSGQTIQHLHNLWIETAAESGLPAAALLLAFCIMRWRLLAQAWRATRGRERRYWAAWLALEFAIFGAGMIFYMLKRNIGLLTWWVWLASLSAGAHAAREPQELK